MRSLLSIQKTPGLLQGHNPHICTGEMFNARKHLKCVSQFQQNCANIHICGLICLSTKLFDTRKEQNKGRKYGPSSSLGEIDTPLLGVICIKCTDMDVPWCSLQIVKTGIF